MLNIPSETAVDILRTIQEIKKSYGKDKTFHCMCKKYAEIYPVVTGIHRVDSTLRDNPDYVKLNFDPDLIYSIQSRIHEYTISPEAGEIRINQRGIWFQAEVYDDLGRVESAFITEDELLNLILENKGRE